MPANRDRKTVIIRLSPEHVRKLDALCVKHGATIDRRVWRSEMIQNLITWASVETRKK